ncbi:hypothetical protein [Streptomyces halstedii]|uniref:hypothetical protein n=1 Tax=Streptomyces halstedii TaxID=1944 RepID=UPI00335BB956
MTMAPDNTTRLELAVTELRGSVDAGMARIEGSLALLVQRAEQSDRRADGHAGQLHRLDERVDTLERTGVTRIELDALAKALRLEAEQREEKQQRAAGRRLTVVSIVVTIAVSLLASGITIIGIIVR